MVTNFLQLIQLLSGSPAAIYVEKNISPGEGLADMQQVVQGISSELVQGSDNVLGDITTVLLSEIDGVEEMRMVLSASYARPYVLPYTILIVVVDTVPSEQIQQLFLKNIEEANEHQRFIFIVKNERELLSTIRSRSVVYWPAYAEKNTPVSISSEESVMAAHFLSATPIKRKSLIESSLASYTKSTTTLLAFIETLVYFISSETQSPAQTTQLLALEECRAFCHTSTQKNLLIHSLIFLPNNPSV